MTGEVQYEIAMMVVRGWANQGDGLLLPNDVSVPNGWEPYAASRDGMDWVIQLRRPTT